MDVYEFGARLIRSKDLDPVYVALTGAGLDRDLLSRVCLAYWSYYHLGAACYIAENPKKFWAYMMKAAQNTDPAPDGGRWPRGAERRHFRGKQSTQAVQELSEHGKPEKIVNNWITGGTYSEVMRRVQKHRGYGPWIGFKIADMADRVLGQPTDFSDCYLGIYKDPVQGAALVRFGDWRHPISSEELKATYDELVKGFKKFKAPPYNDRPINLQEAETVCCKFKSYSKGKYWVGKDILEVGHGLKGWGDVAQQVLQHMPEEVARG